MGGPAPATLGPLTAQQTDADLTVRIKSRLTHITYTMGDGTTIQCGPGTVWNPTYKDQSSPTCGHRYQHTGTYTITGTTHWITDWEGQGQHGTIPLDLTTQPTTLIMKDAQVLNTSEKR